MSLANLVVLKTLLLLWIFCAVVCEHHKRDVHRIIIKQRIPRSQKKGHPSHNHSHGHKHSHRHNNSGKGHNHGHKGKKHHGSYEKDGSLEDNGSLSRENSFEDLSHSHKVHKSHHNTYKYHRRPLHATSKDYEELKQEHSYRDDSRMTFHNEWIPLSSEQVQEPSQETHRSRYRWRKDGNNKKHYMGSLKPPPLEITTSYPFQFETSSIFPQLTSYSSAISNYNLHKQFIESNQSPLIGTIEQPKLFSELRHDFDKMNNHRANYEVTELIPAESNINTIISIPDDNTLVLSNEGPTTEEPIKQTYVKVKSTQRPRNPRNRGRVNYRASMK